MTSFFQVAGKADLLALVNAQNATTLLSTDVVFSNPKATNGTWNGVATPLNSAVQISAAGGSAYAGSKVVLYNRLDLASLLTLPNWHMQASNPVTVADLLDSFLFYTGCIFDSSDFDLTQPVTVNEDGSGSVTITALDSSVGWYGTATFTFTFGGASLPNLTSVFNLPGLNYTNATAVPGTDILAEPYLFGYDFTPEAASLAAIPTGVLSGSDATTLSTLLQAVDQGNGATLWNTTASTAWSLSGATVVVNGANSGDPAANPNYANLMKISLASGVSEPVGVLYLHYNAAFDPNNF